jgi:putative transposase
MILAMDTGPTTLRRTYRYRLYPTSRQRAALEAQLRFACELYNAAVEQRRNEWRRSRRLVSRAAQFRELTDIRAHRLGPPGMSCHAMRDPLRRVDLAFAAFFRRLKSADTPGFPRFRSWRRYDSLSSDAWTLKSSRVVLPGIGHMKVRWHRQLPTGARVRTVTVRRRVRHWYVGFSLDLPRPTPKPSTGKAVGIDLGVSTFAALSTGELLGGPRAFRSARRRLRNLQRVASRRVRGSRRRQKARLMVSRLHERIRYLRRDHAFKMANDLVGRFDVFYVEALNVRGLCRGMLAQDIHDQAWGAFLRILTDKAAEAGRSVVALDPRNTSQTCSACGAQVPKPLAERWHRCACGYQADRDVNAARNIYRFGESRQASTWPNGASVA